MSLNKINISEKKDRDGNIIKQFTMNEYIPCSDEEKAIYGVDKKLNAKSEDFYLEKIKTYDIYDSVELFQVTNIFTYLLFLKEENAIEWIKHKLTKNKGNNESK